MIQSWLAQLIYNEEISLRGRAAGLRLRTESRRADAHDLGQQRAAPAASTRHSRERYRILVPGVQRTGRRV